MAKGYILVEGHGEVEAAGNLVTRLWCRTGHALPWDRPRRCVNIHLQHGLARSVERIRARPDVGALLILRDAEDECPRHKAPELAMWLRGFGLPFPAAVVLLHPEYEVLFLPCVDRMAGPKRAIAIGPGAHACADPAAREVQPERIAGRRFASSPVFPWCDPG
jgi:hypothetical protein